MSGNNQDYAKLPLSYGGATVFADGSANFWDRLEGEIVFTLSPGEIEVLAIKAGLLPKKPLVWRPARPLPKKDGWYFASWYSTKPTVMSEGLIWIGPSTNHEISTQIKWLAGPLPMPEAPMIGVKAITKTLWECPNPGCQRQHETIEGDTKTSIKCSCGITFYLEA